jgi:excisionase family DNA binding protein
VTSESRRGPDGIRPDALLTLQQASALMQCHSRTLRRWIHQGTLRAYRCGRVLRIRREDLDACLVPAQPQSGHDSDVAAFIAAQIGAMRGN